MTTMPASNVLPRKRARADGSLSDADYELLAAFRFALRRYARFSEDEARAAGLTAQHYQALLAVRAQPAGETTIGTLAQQLLLKHHSAVGLVDRLAAQGLLARAAAPDSRRKVAVVLTAKGTRVLESLAHVHRDELERSARELTELLQGITEAMSWR